MTQTATVEKLRVVAALSGGGRTLLNLLEHQESLHYRIVGVVSSSPEARGVALARERGLPLFVADFASSLPVQEELAAWLNGLNCNLVALCGFLKKFPCLSGWERRIINIHPALLPQHKGKGMYGMRVHEAVWESQAGYSGATIHYVTEEYDEGPLIAQVKVPLTQDDAPQEIASKVFAAECQLYPAVLDRLARSLLPLNNGAIWQLIMQGDENCRY